MVLVVPHSGPVFDEVAHAARGPQPGSNPNASGPRLSACSIPRNWAGLSLARRPVCLALRKPRMPDCSSSRAQRLTDCRCTPPTTRATSDWLSPS